MKLIPISEHPDAARILYDLLAERSPEASISHKKMPTWEEHLAFIHSQPYADWCLVEGAYHGGISPPTYPIVGAVYLTRNNEIGVAVFRNLRGVGWGSQAVRMMMEKHGERRYFANVAPGNEPSRRMFEKLGFKHVQNTYALEVE